MKMDARKKQKDHKKQPTREKRAQNPVSPVL
jgi:hypothetical protein